MYKAKCLDQIEKDHGRLDGATFVLMIVGNLAAHRTLTMSLRVSQSEVPLKIISAPLHTQAGSVKIYMWFMEFLSRRVLTIQEKLGPGTGGVPLESDAGQVSGKLGRSPSPSPKCKTPPPSRHGSPALPAQVSPTRVGKPQQAPTPIGKISMFSPHSRQALNLWKDLEFSDDSEEYHSGGEEKSISLPPSMKRQHGSSDEENKTPVKKSKVDISNLYGTNGGTDKEKHPGKTNKTDQDKLEDTSKSKKDKKHKRKHKKHSKNKDEKDKEKETNKKTPEKKTGDRKPPGKATPTPKTPKADVLDLSDDEGSGVPTPTKSKKPARTVEQCRANKWAHDLASVVSFHQWMNISMHNLAQGRNNNDYTDYMHQLMRQENKVNIKSLDDRIQELQGLTSSHHTALRKALTKWRTKKMGNSGVKPEFVVKAFLEPGTE